MRVATHRRCSSPHTSVSDGDLSRTVTDEMNVTTLMAPLRCMRKTRYMRGIGYPPCRDAAMKYLHICVIAMLTFAITFADNSWAQITSLKLQTSSPASN